MNAGFWLVAGLLGFFSAVRYRIGIDYEAYEYHIDLIQKHVPHYMETGFQKLVLVLSEISAEPVFIIMIVGIATTWFFVSAVWEQSENICMGIFLFISWGYYFLTYNTIRNYFALALVLYAIRFIERDKKLAFIFTVLLAASIHKSALVCIPLYLLADLKWKKVYYLLLVSGTGFTLAAKKYIRKLVFLFYAQYESGIYDTGRISYMNIVRSLGVVFLCASFFNIIKKDRMNRMYFHLNLFSLAFYTGMYWVPEISRIGFYMNATSIFLLPRVLSDVSNREKRNVIKVILYAGSMVLFIALCSGFYGETIRILPYRTWLMKGSY